MTPAQRQQRRRDKLRALQAPEGIHTAMLGLLDQLDQVRVDRADDVLAKLGIEIAKRRRRRARELAEHRQWRRACARRVRELQRGLR